MNLPPGTVYTLALPDRETPIKKLVGTLSEPEARALRSSTMVPAVRARPDGGDHLDARPLITLRADERMKPRPTAAEAENKTGPES